MEVRVLPPFLPFFLFFSSFDVPIRGDRLFDGWFLRAIYVDGEMIPAQKGASADPKPCAGNDGTTVTVRRWNQSPYLFPHSPQHAYVSTR